MTWSRAVALVVAGAVPAASPIAARAVILLGSLVAALPAVAGLVVVSRVVPSGAGRRVGGGGISAALAARSRRRAGAVLSAIRNDLRPSRGGGLGPLVVAFRVVACLRAALGHHDADGLSRPRA